MPRLLRKSFRLKTLTTIQLSKIKQTHHQSKKSTRMMVRHSILTAPHWLKRSRLARQVRFSTSVNRPITPNTMKMTKTTMNEMMMSKLIRATNLKIKMTLQRKKTMIEGMKSEKIKYDDNDWRRNIELRWMATVLIDLHMSWLPN